MVSLSCNGSFRTEHPRGEAVANVSCRNVKAVATGVFSTGRTTKIRWPGPGLGSFQSKKRSYAPGAKRHNDSTPPACTHTRAYSTDTYDPLEAYRVRAAHAHAHARARARASACDGGHTRRGVAAAAAIWRRHVGQRRALEPSPSLLEEVDWPSAVHRANDDGGRASCSRPPTFRFETLAPTAVPTTRTMPCQPPPSPADRRRRRATPYT